MRFRYYLTTASNALETVDFTAGDFREVGLPYMSFGMPQTEALELVNRWNRTALGRYSYWLGEGE